MGEDCGSIKAVRVTSIEATVTVRSGEIGSLRLPAIDTESLKKIKLSGGTFGTISFAVSGPVTITDLLEAGLCPEG